MLLRNLCVREKHDLRIFKEKAHSLLMDLPPEHRRLTSTFEMRGNKHSIQIESWFPNRNMLRLIASHLRLFYLTEHCIEIGHICNILYRRLASDDLRSQVGEIHHYYNEQLRSTGIGIVQNDTKKTSRDVLEMWLYSEIEHIDDDKAEAYKKFGFLEPVPKTVIVDVLNSIMYCVVALSSIVDQVF